MQLILHHASAFVLASICLLISLSWGCTGNPNAVCLHNEKLGYYIEYPANWELEPNAISIDAIYSSNIWAPAPYHGLIVITVYDNYQATAKDAAHAVLDQCRADYQGVVVMVNKKVSDEWDWYLQLDYFNPGIGSFHDTYHYKQAGNRLYEVQTTGSTDDYEKLGFEGIVKTFRLTQ